jgi:hypothetical protein
VVEEAATFFSYASCWSYGGEAYGAEEEGIAAMVEAVEKQSSLHFVIVIQP